MMQPGIVTPAKLIPMPTVARVMTVEAANSVWVVKGLVLGLMDLEGFSAIRSLGLASTDST